MKACLIIGNGPSANDVPVHDLASMPSYGMNFCKLQPMYYVCVDSRVLTEFPHLIRPLVEGAEIAYLSAKHAGGTRPGHIGNLYDLPNVQLVWRDHGSFAAERYMSGMTATYVCLKLAYYAGFTEVHLWGVDHSEDWAHYREDYPQDQAATRRERMKLMEWHYQLCMNVYARAGRSIVNHSAPSKLDMIFRRAA